MAGKKLTGALHLEVVGRHRSGEQKSGGAREETGDYECAAKELDHASRPIFESSGGMAPSNGGKPNSFCDPCINKRAAAKARSRLNMRGAQALSVSFIVRFHRTWAESAIASTSVVCIPGRSIYRILWGGVKIRRSGLLGANKDVGVLPFLRRKEALSDRPPT